MPIYLYLPIPHSSSVAVWQHTGGELFIAEPDQHMVWMSFSPAPGD